MLRSVIINRNELGVREIEIRTRRGEDDEKFERYWHNWTWLDWSTVSMTFNHTEPRRWKDHTKKRARFMYPCRLFVAPEPSLHCTALHSCCCCRRHHKKLSICVKKTDNVKKKWNVPWRLPVEGQRPKPMRCTNMRLLQKTSSWRVSFQVTKEWCLLYLCYFGSSVPGSAASQCIVSTYSHQTQKEDMIRIREPTTS